MNLHGIATPMISIVNPMVTISIRRSTGSVIAPGGKSTPQYAAPVDVQAQIQALSGGDLAQINGLNLQGEMRSVYINGRSDAIIREDRKGGDLITWNGIVWLNTHVLEYWPDWCKFVITRQDGS